MGVYHGDPMSATAVQRFFARNGLDVHGNPMATGGAPNAPPYGMSPFSGNGCYRDPYTGLQSAATSGMAGNYDGVVGADEEDDLAGVDSWKKLHPRFFGAVNTGTGHVKGALEIAAGFHPLVNAQSAWTGRDAASGRKLNRWERGLAGLSVVPAGALEGVVVKGFGAVARGVKNVENLRGVGGGGPKFVLGLGEDLERFRKFHNGTSYEKSGEGIVGFGGTISDFHVAMTNPYAELHFNLTAPSDTVKGLRGLMKSTEAPANIFIAGCVQKGYELGRSNENITNWELAWLHDHPEVWGRLNFWSLENGTYVPVPFPWK